jgi:hypothetical protein
LSAAVAELKRCGEVLISIADSLKGLSAENADTETLKQPKTEISAPEKKPFTLETVRATLADKSREGFSDAIRELIKKHGVEKLSEIDPTEYPALLAEVKVMKNG